MHTKPTSMEPNLKQLWTSFKKNKHIFNIYFNTILPANCQSLPGCWGVRAATAGNRTLLPVLGHRTWPPKKLGLRMHRFNLWMENIDVYLSIYPSIHPSIYLCIYIYIYIYYTIVNYKLTYSILTWPWHINWPWQSSLGSRLRRVLLRSNTEFFLLVLSREWMGMGEWDYR